MATISATDIKKLRDLTGGGMMDCKRALEEADGDFQKAVEILRIKGNKDAGKRAERTTANGLVASVDGAMIELDCETDFVAKNEDFQALAAKVVATVAGSDGSVEGVLAAPLDDGTVADAIALLSARIGEKLVLRRVVKYDGASALYLHKRSADLPPAIGVLLAYTGADAEAARVAAMQVASLKARFVSREAVPADVLDAEKRIAEATAREEGKPEAALSKIVDGRLAGFYKEAVLLEQPSVRDNKQTVGAQLAAAGVSVTAFERFEVGTV